MEIKTQFSNCGCAVMESDTGELHIQPSICCDVEHDWDLIIAGLENKEMPLFEVFDA
jgi:hypothetical protein